MVQLRLSVRFSRAGDEPEMTWSLEAQLRALSVPGVMGNLEDIQCRRKLYIRKNTTLETAWKDAA